MTCLIIFRNFYALPHVKSLQKVVSRLSDTIELQLFLFRCCLLCIPRINSCRLHSLFDGASCSGMSMKWLYLSIKLPCFSNTTLSNLFWLLYTIQQQYPLCLSQASLECLIVNIGMLALFFVTSVGFIKYFKILVFSF